MQDSSGVLLAVTKKIEMNGVILFIDLNAPISLRESVIDLILLLRGQLKNIVEHYGDLRGVTNRLHTWNQLWNRSSNKKSPVQPA